MWPGWPIYKNSNIPQSQWVVAECDACQVCGLFPGGFWATESSWIWFKALSYEQTPLRQKHCVPMKGILSTTLVIDISWEVKKKTLSLEIFVEAGNHLCLLHVNSAKCKNSSNLESVEFDRNREITNYG